VATGRLIDDDPEAALAFARAARGIGARLGVVREAVGVAAYRAGEWAEALAELRAARRITGDFSHLPIMADCERALGRPERALALAHSAEVSTLRPELRVEMRIVESGARRDLGQLEAALVALQGPDVDRRVVRPWSARLWYAYADVLLALDRTDEARDWFLAAAAVDIDGTTDAAEQLLELDGITVLADAADGDPDGDATGHDPGLRAGIAMASADAADGDPDGDATGRDPGLGAGIATGLADVADGDPGASDSDEGGELESVSRDDFGLDEGGAVDGGSDGSIVDAEDSSGGPGGRADHDATPAQPGDLGEGGGPVAGR
jgi:hypothetical protein